MTPFSLAASREYLAELYDIIMPDGKAEAKGMFAPLSYIYDFDIKCVIRFERTEKELNRSKKELIATGMTEEEAEKCLDDYDLDSDLAAETWAAACIIDSAFCGTVYGDAPELFAALAEGAKADSKRKKLLSRKPVYDIPLILRHTAEALDYVLGTAAGSGLADEMHSAGKFGEFERSVTELQTRLRNAADDIGEEE